MHVIMPNKTLLPHCLKTEYIIDTGKSQSNYHVVPEVQLHKCMNHPKGLQGPE
jgi:hypothetical protein